MESIAEDVLIKLTLPRRNYSVYGKSNNRFQRSKYLGAWIERDANLITYARQVTKKAHFFVQKARLVNAKRMEGASRSKSYMLR